MICEALAVDMSVAEKIMNKMSIAGFRFSVSSEEEILSEAKFIQKYCL
jgi:predicted nucleic acid-binding protein